MFKVASSLYSQNCDEYNVAKATVSSEDGQKVYKKKRVDVNDTQTQREDTIPVQQKNVDSIKQNIQSISELANLRGCEVSSN